MSQLNPHTWLHGSVKWLFILVFPFFSSCYKEVVLTEPDADLFELLVTEETERFIYESRDTSYSVESEQQLLLFNGTAIALDEIRVRGKSALRFRRKSYTVWLHEPIFVNSREGSFTKQLTRFKLIALAQDYTYIENRISFGLMEEAGLMPLFYKFVEFRINGSTQGVYLLIEDPEQFYKENGSEYILRRGYNHGIDDAAYFPSFHFIAQEDYTSRFREIYQALPQMEGTALFEYISDRLDTEQYFFKMGMDYLLMNGDYTDEVYLYAVVSQDTIRYKLIPWDYDDIFREQPHEVGVQWGTGTIYGKRTYTSLQDITDAIGDKLIFSIEDDLDYTVAIDPVLYQQYLDALQRLTNIIDNDLIDRVFDETEQELSTFYDAPAVIEQSRYDTDPASRERWMEQLVEKKQFLKERLASINNSLEP